MTDKESYSSPLDLAKLISICIKLFFWNSYINESKDKDFHQNSLKTFKKSLINELIALLRAEDLTPELRNRKILIFIRNIQKHILSKSNNSAYSLLNFLDLCKQIRISDLQYIQMHLKNTLHLIKSKKYQDFITKFDLLINLVNQKLFYETSSKVTGNKSYSRIINQIAIISSNFDKNLIVELFKDITLDNELIDFVDQVFPYFLFKNSQLKRVSFWIPLAKMLIKSRIRFSYTINDNIFDFNQSSKYEFSFNLIMNEKDNLSLSKESAIQLGYKNKSMKINEGVSEKNDYIYYSIIKELTHHTKPTLDEKLLDALLSKYTKMFEEKSIIIDEENSILSLKDIFNQTQTPLINLIWNIVFSLPDYDITNLSKIIHPIESKLLLSSLMIFNNLKIDMIDEIIIWSKWASGFEYNTPILFKILLETSIILDTSSNIDDVIFALKNEINYLRKAPESMKEFWNSDDLIEKCKKNI